MKIYLNTNSLRIILYKFILAKHETILILDLFNMLFNDDFEPSTKSK